MQVQKSADQRVEATEQQAADWIAKAQAAAAKQVEEVRAQSKKDIDEAREKAKGETERMRQDLERLQDETSARVADAERQVSEKMVRHQRDDATPGV